MADETQQATTNSALPFGSRAKQGISQFHGVRSYLCAHVRDRASSREGEGGERCGTGLKRTSQLGTDAAWQQRTNTRRRQQRLDTMAALVRHGLFKNSNQYNAVSNVNIYFIFILLSLYNLISTFLTSFQHNTHITLVLYILDTTQ